ncbi:hypothetical protein Rs2_45703 [Raphanus sativus]|nr:hypothetical protein Rs2_45703 [Raphanus sativus]
MWSDQPRIPFGGFATENFSSGTKRQSYTLQHPSDVELLAVHSAQRSRFLLAIELEWSNLFSCAWQHGATVRTLNKPQDVKKNLRGEYDNRHGSTSSKMLQMKQMLREASVSEVCEAFKVARGMVQALQENAGRFCFHGFRVL